MADLSELLDLISDAAVEAYNEGEASGYVTNCHLRGRALRRAAIRAGLCNALPHLAGSPVAIADLFAAGCPKSPTYDPTKGTT